MSAIIIDGKAIAQKLREEARERAIRITEKTGIVPCLAVILAGEDPASVSYVTGKEKAITQACMESRNIRLPADISETELISRITGLNKEDSVHGILVQLPLPRRINEDRIILAIDPAKDVDGLHPVSAGNLASGRPGILPCTPYGVMVLLRELEILLDGAHAVVVGRSSLVGRPLANLLSRRDANATVTVCHTGTKDLDRYTLQADILIAAAGSPALITHNMVKPGAVVIDVGVNRIADASKKSGFRLCGDVDFETVKEKASYITPVPGGVGPMTVAMLLHNVLQCAEVRIYGK